MHFHVIYRCSFGDFEIKPVYDCAPGKWKMSPWLSNFFNPLGAGYVLSAVKQETRVHILKTHWRNCIVKRSFGLAGATRQPSQNKQPLEHS